LPTPALSGSGHEGFDLSHTIAFGDGGNDTSMILQAGIGIAMGNAIDELKQQADYVTTSVDDDGVLNALRHFQVIPSSDRRQELSILIPVYNSDCRQQVTALSYQAETIEGLRCEIVVADDGSDDVALQGINAELSALPNVRYIRREQNVGRAAIRNYLAHEARYEWLLFMDGDMAIPADIFLKNWVEAEADEVAYGGYVVGEGSRSSLRFIYEKENEPMHRAEERKKRPYQHFHTCNFLIRRDLMLANPFDERFRHYGYEDVLLGKQLRQAGITISHIDNPVGFDSFEDNPSFVKKTEEGLHTLYEFRNELRGYNCLLTLVGGIHVGLVRAVIRLWHRLFGGLERKHLCGGNPNLTVFRLYRLGYYLNIT
jgi:glycosyltransferase involved in cell wall biosynthesis